MLWSFRSKRKFRRCDKAGGYSQFRIQSPAIGRPSAIGPLLNSTQTGSAFAMTWRRNANSQYVGTLKSALRGLVN